MSDAGFVIAGYVITAAVLVAYVAWLAWRFRQVGASMPTPPTSTTQKNRVAADDASESRSVS